MATSAQLRQEITAGQWDHTLCMLYGAELERQRSRWCAALEQFERYFGPGRQVRLYSAPGRAELGGNHTDHQHGYGLAAAVTLDLVAVVSCNREGYIRVKSRGFNKLDVIDLSENAPQEGESTHSASLIRGIAEGFRAAGKQIGGFDAYTTSDVLRGSGLSSSAAFEMGIAAILNGEYGCGLSPVGLARIAHYAENTYFGKPSGLLDPLASAVGGVIFADFADPSAPRIDKLHIHGLIPEGMSLCVTDTCGSHSELTTEFAAIRQEMEAVAACFGKQVMAQVPQADFWAQLPSVRRRCGDRAVLRAIHFYEENDRALAQRDALRSGNFAAFLELVRASGHASFTLCQNVFRCAAIREQELPLALALSQSLLESCGGAWRMQGGGFAGTIQAFVPTEHLGHYCGAMEAVFGPGCCHVLRMREQGAAVIHMDE
ncbi:MAG: galactokinase [Faecalibacterium sp.]